MKLAWILIGLFYLVAWYDIAATRTTHSTHKE
jgi:hypothetical protein